MTKVPDYHNKPFKPIYAVGQDGPASLKQKNLIITLHERRRLPIPDLGSILKTEAAVMISNMLNDRYWENLDE